jgi:hypothetical protein
VERVIEAHGVCCKYSFDLAPLGAMPRQELAASRQYRYLKEPDLAKSSADRFRMASVALSLRFILIAL